MAAHKTTRPHLIVHKGTLTGRIHSIDRKIITLGRDQTNDIVIRDIAISRSHARLICNNPQTLEFMLEDLASTNGTSINGKPIKGAAPVKIGDEILLAHDVYVFIKNGTLYDELLFDQDETVHVLNPRYKPNPSLTHEVNSSLISPEERRAYKKALDDDNASIHEDPTSADELSPYVFISYSRKDEALMQQIVATLTAANIAVWVDQHQLEYGEPSFRRTIQTAIEQSACVLVILTPDAKESQWVERECDYAEAQEKRIYCVLAKGNRGTAILFGLTSSHWVNIQLDYEREMEKLVQSIRQYIAGR